MELRGFAFTNAYLSGVHPPIQAGHAYVEMGRRYDSDQTPAGEVYREWADHHKTFIFKGGLDHNGMEQLLWPDIVRACVYLELPYARFYEPGLNNTLTAIAFVAPKCVWEWKDTRPWVNDAKLGRYRQGDLSEREEHFQTLATFLNHFGLCR